MKRYLIGLLIIYFCNLKETLSTNQEQQTNTVVNYDLRKLRQSGHTSKEDSTNNTKKYLFNAESHSGLKKVFYHTTDLLTLPKDGKNLKQLEAWEKKSVLQLVHLKLVNGQSEEDLYYKKEKSQFVKLNDNNSYTSELNSLKNNRDHFVDKWFAVDFRKKEDFAPFFRESVSMVDGVWKRSLTRVNGQPYALLDGEQEVWSHTNEGEMESLDEFDFGDSKYLLVFNFKASKKYFVKNGSANWASLADEAQFKTKYDEFKALFFANALEYDVSKPPDLTKFATRRKVLNGNAYSLTLHPVRNYYLSKVMYNETELWTANKDKRAPTLSMLLLGYEVKQFTVFERTGTDQLQPECTRLYFSKESTGFVTKNKDDFDLLKKKHEASGDQRNFQYNSNWVQTAGRLNLAEYNESEFTVATQTNELLVTKTLTPKGNNVFTQVGFKNTQLWPSTNNPATNPVVKEVKYVSKNSTVQLVRVKGTRSLSRGDTTSGTEEVEFLFKLDSETLVPLNSQQYDEYLKLLEQKDYFVYKDFDLDVTDEAVNPVFFKVVKDYFDGVEKRVVTPVKTKVTRVHSLGHDLWTQEHNYKDKYLDEYELLVLGAYKLLKLKFTVLSSNSSTWNYFEKPEHVQWTPLDQNAFNAKLNALRNVSQWESLELDVSTKPLKTKFNVVVNRLNGNRTELVLTPLWQKKLVKVKLGSTDVWTSTQNKRVERVYLYLEAYDAKFLKLDVLTPQESGSPLKSEEKFYKQTSTFATVSDFDNQLSQFKTHNNNVAFTYNENWELPPEVLDPKSYPSEFFDFAKTTETLVATLKYTPKTQAVVKKVLYDGVKVWPEGDTENTTKKLAFLEVFTKHDMVQLLHVQNVLVATPTTTEDLYFKKVKDTYPKVEKTEFDQLKGKLSQEDSYVDDNVKLDLTEEVSTELFAKETTVEDGLEKEVVQLLHGKLYEVKASPPLWTSTDGSYVKKLEKYNLGDSQLLVLHVTKTDNSVEKLYFHKPTTPPVVPASTSDTQTQESREQTQSTQPTGDTVTEQTSRQQTPGVSPGAPEAARPSFAALPNKGEFFKKLKEKKATVQYSDVELNLDSYNDTSKFKVVLADSENYKVYKLYPLPGKRVTVLNHGTESHWTKSKDGQRLVEAWVYLHEGKAKFVKGLVWDKDHTDESTDHVVLLQLNTDTNKYEVKDQTTFNAQFEKVLSVRPQPLPLSTGLELPTKTRVLKKLFLGQNVDSLLFDVTNQASGDKSVRTLAPKKDVFVNLVETRGSVLWKSYQNDDLWKSAKVTTKGQSGHAELTVSENSEEVKKYFKFSNDVWTKVNLDEYNKLEPPAGSVRTPEQPASQQGTVNSQEPQRDSVQQPVTQVETTPEGGSSQPTVSQESSSPSSPNGQSGDPQVPSVPDATSNTQDGRSEPTGDQGRSAEQGNKVTVNQVGQEASRVEARDSNPEHSPVPQVDDQNQGGHQTELRGPVSPEPSSSGQNVNQVPATGGSSPSPGLGDSGRQTVTESLLPETLSRAVDGQPRDDEVQSGHQRGQDLQSDGRTEGTVPKVPAPEVTSDTQTSEEHSTRVVLQEASTEGTSDPQVESAQLPTPQQQALSSSERRGSESPSPPGTSGHVASSPREVSGSGSVSDQERGVGVSSGGPGGSGSLPGSDGSGTQRDDSTRGVGGEAEVSPPSGGDQAPQESGNGERGSTVTELPGPKVPGVASGQSEDTSDRSLTQGTSHASTDGRGPQESQDPHGSGVGGQAGSEGEKGRGSSEVHTQGPENTRPGPIPQEQSSDQNGDRGTDLQDQEARVESPAVDARSQESQVNSGVSGRSGRDGTEEGQSPQTGVGNSVQLGAEARGEAGPEGPGGGGKPGSSTNGNQEEGQAS